MAIASRRCAAAVVIAFAAVAGSALPAAVLVDAARAQIGVTTAYDPGYVRLEYPGGDVPVDRGVCTDVVIRALRSSGLDLQRAVHEDMRSDFSAYPRLWGLSRPDRNIDHRRVPNLEVYFRRSGWALPAGSEVQPGDVLNWRLPDGRPHVGVVSDRRGGSGHWAVIHNIGRGVREEDVIGLWSLAGHFRPRAGAARPAASR